MVLSLTCHVFIKEMSQRDDRLTTRGMTSLAPDCKSGIQAVLDAAGPNYRLANPQTWPDQADLAARNRWPSLKAMQDGLTGGNRKA